MKRSILLGAAAAAAIAIGLPSAALAATPGYVSTDLNLRAGPSTDYPVVDTMPEGSRVHIQGCTSRDGWCNLVFHGEYGWASADYLRFLYRGRRVVLPEYWTYADVPIISFSIGPYWREHYRHRGFYARIGDYGNGGHYQGHAHHYVAGPTGGRHAHARMIGPHVMRHAAHHAAHRVHGLANFGVHAGGHHARMNFGHRAGPHHARMNFAHQPGPRHAHMNFGGHGHAGFAAHAQHGGPGHGGPHIQHGGPGGHPGHGGPHHHGH